MSSLLQRFKAALQAALGKTEEEAKEIVDEGKILLVEIENYVKDEVAALEQRLTGKAPSPTPAPTPVPTPEPTKAANA